MDGQWSLNDQGVVCFVSGGHRIDATALEVWEAEFAPESSRFPMPSIDLPQIEFMGAVLNLDLVLRLNPIGLVEAMLSTSSDPRLIVLDAWPTSDQLIRDSQWFALDSSYLAEVKESLESHAVQLGQPLSNEQLMWLYWSSGLGIEPLEQAPNAGDSVSDYEYEPELIHASLYPYQIAGSRFLASMSNHGLGTLLADEMGLGKTIQAIYLMSHENKQGHGVSLVVCPSAIITNWHREVSRFTPWLRVHIHKGPTRTGDTEHFSNFDLVITSYEILTRDVAIFDSFRWNLVVLDEAQAIKNPEAKRSIATKRLTQRIGVAITGTPIENSLKDMWSIIEFVAPSYLGTQRQFERNYPDELAAAHALSRRVAPLVLRRTISEVARDLPDRVDIPIAIDGGEEFAHQYETVRQSPNVAPLALLTKLRQVCATPCIGTGKYSFSEFPKYEVALKIILEAFKSGAKVLLFASFTESLDRIANDLRWRLPQVFLRVLDGRTSADQRQLHIDEFSGFSGPAVLLMNPRATGVGLNIQAASHVIHFTPEWNPATVAQATARAHRTGQVKTVFVHYLFIADTVEEAMIDRLQSKRQLQEAGLSEMDNDLSQADLLEALTRTPVRNSNVY